MKQLFTLLLLAFALGISAQAPQSIPYQAVVRNSDGSVMAEAAIIMTFKIHDNSATGNVVYEENHSATTNAQGLISLNVGNGIVVSGTFSGINWGSGSKFLHVLMNVGNGAVDLGTQQMMSVPYALYAAKSGEISSSSNLQVGQSHAGGKIFYLDESGQHGLVYAEMPVYPQYNRTIDFNLFGECIGAGKLNNRMYINGILPIYYSDYTNDAIIYCDTLNFGGFSDWYLPSSYELYELLYHDLQNFPLGYFLSSTDGHSSYQGGGYGDGGTVLRPVIVQHGNAQYENGSYEFLNFNFGVCAWSAGYYFLCSGGGGYVIPIRSF
jgi:hypothetical protein